MKCLLCGKRLALLQRLKGFEFCSEEHRREFQREQEQLALSRLIDAAQESARMNRETSRRRKSRKNVAEPTGYFDKLKPAEPAAADARTNVRRDLPHPLTCPPAVAAPASLRHVASAVGLCWPYGVDIPFAALAEASRGTVVAQVSPEALLDSAVCVVPNGLAILPVDWSGLAEASRDTLELDLELAPAFSGAVRTPELQCWVLRLRSVRPREVPLRTGTKPPALPRAELTLTGAEAGRGPSAVQRGIRTGALPTFDEPMAATGEPRQRTIEAEPSISASVRSPLGPAPAVYEPPPPIYAPPPPARAAWNHGDWQPPQAGPVPVPNSSGRPGTRRLSKTLSRYSPVVRCVVPVASQRRRGPALATVGRVVLGCGAATGPCRPRAAQGDAANIARKAQVPVAQATSPAALVHKAGLIRTGARPRVAQPKMAIPAAENLTVPAPVAHIPCTAIAHGAGLGPTAYVRFRWVTAAASDSLTCNVQPGEPSIEVLGPGPVTAPRGHCLAPEAELGVSSRILRLPYDALTAAPVRATDSGSAACFLDQIPAKFGFNNPRARIKTVPNVPAGYGGWRRVAERAGQAWSLLPNAARRGGVLLALLLASYAAIPVWRSGGSTPDRQGAGAAKDMTVKAQFPAIEMKAPPLDAKVVASPPPIANNPGGGIELPGAGTPAPSDRAAGGLPPAGAGEEGTFMQRVKAAISRRAAIALTDDFRNGLSNWEGTGDWASHWAYDAVGFVRTGPLALYSPSLELRDYRMEFLGQIEKRGFGWVVRAQDFKNYYAIRLVVTSAYPRTELALVRHAVIDGKPGPETRRVVHVPQYHDTMYRVQTELRGADFAVRVQGLVADTWTDDRFRSGGVGFFSSRGEQGRLRWVGVWHQYDTLGRLCALLAPTGLSATREE